jgi:thiol-disulfide isomerase/thioredoxin
MILDIILRMLRRHTLFLFLILFSGIYVYSQQIEWQTDITEAQKVAKGNGKPILFDFTAKWCGPCQNMERNFWPRADIVELSKKFVCVKVNFDRNKPFAGKYGVRGIPNVVFTDPWGRGLTYQLGFSGTTEGEILEKIRFLPGDFSPIMQAGNALDADEKNLEALHKVADFYQERKLYWQGTDFLKRILKLELDPAKRENVLVNLAFNHIRLGQPEDAIDRFERLEKEYSDSKEYDLFLYGVMYAYIKKNKLQNAEKTLSELKSKFPGSRLVPQAEKNLQEAKEKKNN